MAEFKKIVLSRDEFKNMTQSYQWDFPFDLKNETYPCITDGGTYVILILDKRTCTNVTLIKKNNRILNYFRLVKKLAELPVDDYYFNSERRLGDKYRMITEILGGSVVVKEGKYYYHINSETAVRNICKKYFSQQLYVYHNDLTTIQGLIHDFMNHVYQTVLSTINDMEACGIHISKEQIKNIYKKYISRTEDIFIDLLYSGLNETDTKALEKGRIDALVKEVIRKKLCTVIIELEKYTGEIIFIVKTIGNARLDYLATIDINEQGGRGDDVKT
jgi:hypothetical protein